MHKEKANQTKFTVLITGRILITVLIKNKNHTLKNNWNMINFTISIFIPLGLVQRVIHVQDLHILDNKAVINHMIIHMIKNKFYQMIWQIILL